MSWKSRYSSKNIKCLEGKYPCSFKLTATITSLILICQDSAKSSNPSVGSYRKCRPNCACFLLSKSKLLRVKSRILLERETPQSYSTCNLIKSSVCSQPRQCKKCIPFNRFLAGLLTKLCSWMPWKSEFSRKKFKPSRRKISLFFQTYPCHNKPSFNLPRQCKK